MELEKRFLMITIYKQQRQEKNKLKQNHFIDFTESTLTEDFVNLYKSDDSDQESRTHLSSR
jgi:hypothetical protein